MKYTVQVHGIEDSRTTFDDDAKGMTFVDDIIDRAVKGRVHTQIDVFASNGAHECGWTVHEDGTIDI